MQNTTTIKNKAILIRNLFQYVQSGCCDEKDYIEGMDKIVNIVAYLEELENEVEGLRPLREDYYEFKFDSKCLKALLEILNNSDDSKKILDEYEKRKRGLMEFDYDEDLPF